MIWIILVWLASFAWSLFLWAREFNEITLGMAFVSLIGGPITAVLLTTSNTKKIVVWRRK